MRGRFISLEGIDGAGKSTHAAWLKEAIAAQGRTVVATREPGGTALGEALRGLLLAHPMTHDTEALLMFAARREHVERVIAPALARGDWVLCDRFSDATFAYQGGGHGVARARIAELERFIPVDCRPDLTILFDVPIAVSRERLDRAQAKGRDLDKFEREEFAFFERVRNAYLERAACEPARFRVVNADRPIPEVRSDLAGFAGFAVSERHEAVSAGAESAARWPELLPWQLAAAREALAARATWPHALLLDGPRGIGKRTFALNLARALLCESPRADGLACGACASCHYTAAGQHPDLQLIEPFIVDEDGDVKVQDPIPVDRIRAMIEWVQLTSHRGRAKVAVIVPAESMNLAAANALLKTLEEPPPATFIMLVAHQPGRLPATLRSRCLRMPAPRPAMAEAEAWLENQGVISPRNALEQAGGAPLAALAMATAAWQAERAAWMQALAKPETLSPVALAAWIEAAPKDQRRERLGQAIDWLAAWTADLGRVAAGGLPARNVDFAAAFDHLAPAVARVPLFRYHRTLLRQRASVAHPLQPRLVAEALLIGYRELFR